MSANVDFVSNRVTRLDRVPDARTPITEDDVSEPVTLVRIIEHLIRDVSKVLGLWRPRRIDFYRVSLDNTGTTKYRLEHRFGGTVRYWVVGWDGASAANIRDHVESTSDVLVVTSTSTGTATIRVEEAGP